jgi:uncharacterized protein YdeI (YjbR/CyaY-like superfamily)
MPVKNPQVDAYFATGCGRCALWNTPECKALRWGSALQKLRNIALGCGLTEELKWSQPVYTFNGKNILLLAAFKDNCALSFFKGALLKDPSGILEKPGENTQAGRVARFTDLNNIDGMADTLSAYILEAIELEKEGRKLEQKSEPTPLPHELLQQFEESPALKAAFGQLTPGRQRSYLLHFSGAKQSATVVARIQKCIPKILEGKGFNER